MLAVISVLMVTVPRPTPADASPGAASARISAGGDHSLFDRSDRAVQGWDDNYYYGLAPTLAASPSPSDAQAAAPVQVYLWCMEMEGWYESSGWSGSYTINGITYSGTITANHSLENAYENGPGSYQDNNCAQPGSHGNGHRIKHADRHQRARHRHRDVYLQLR